MCKDNDGDTRASSIDGWGRIWGSDGGVQRRGDAPCRETSSCDRDGRSFSSNDNRHNISIHQLTIQYIEASSLAQHAERIADLGLAGKETKKYGMIMPLGIQVWPEVSQPYFPLN